MDFKKKYKKYKSKYLELKKQNGGIDQSIDDIYIKLWKTKDSKEFDDNKDGLVSKEEYYNNIGKYFNFKIINFNNLDNEYFDLKLKNIFENSDINKDHKISNEEEQKQLSKELRSKFRLRIKSKNNLKSDKYIALKKILGMEHICPLGGTDRKFKHTSEFSTKDTEKILKMFFRMRYLVEVKGRLEYITLDDRIEYEKEIFNLICNDKVKCKFHDLRVSDFESSTIDEYIKILKIIKKYEDPNIEGSLVVHCGKGLGRTGTVFMIYIWFMDYINNIDDCKKETDYILTILNELNKVLIDTKKEISTKENIFSKRYFKMIEDLDKITGENLKAIIRKRKNFELFTDDLNMKLEKLFENKYLISLRNKIKDNYNKGAAYELLDEKDDIGTFFVRLYRMIKAIYKTKLYYDN
jgi:hypothetical protein